MGTPAEERKSPFTQQPPPVPQTPVAPTPASERTRLAQQYHHTIGTGYKKPVDVFDLSKAHAEYKSGTPGAKERWEQTVQQWKQRGTYDESKRQDRISSLTLTKRRISKASSGTRYKVGDKVVSKEEALQSINKELYVLQKIGKIKTKSELQKEWEASERAKGNTIITIEKTLAKLLGSESNEAWQIVSLDKDGLRFIQAYREAQNWMDDFDTVKRGEADIKQWLEHVAGYGRLAFITFGWDILAELKQYQSNATTTRRQEIINKLADNNYGQKVLHAEGPVGFAKFFMASPAGAFGTSVATGMGIGALASVLPKTATVVGGALTVKGAADTIGAVQRGELPVWRAGAMTGIGIAGGYMGFKATTGMFTPPVFNPKGTPAKINLAIETGIEKGKLLFYKPIWKARSVFLRSVSKGKAIPPETIFKKETLLPPGQKDRTVYGTIKGGPKATIKAFEQTKAMDIPMYDTKGDYVGVHTTPHKFRILSKTKIGTSETPATSLSPYKGGTPRFLGYDKVSAYPSTLPKKTSVALLPKLRMPRVTTWKFKDLFRLPKSERYLKPGETTAQYYARTGKLLLQQPRGKYATIAPKHEIGGGEAEALVTARTTIYRQPSLRPYYTEVPTSFGKVATPVEPIHIISGKTPKGLVKIGGIRDTIISKLSPLYSEKGTTYYSALSPSVTGTIGLSSIPSKPSKPSIISYPSRPSKPSVPSVPSRPSISLKTSYPSITSKPSAPSIPSAPSYPSGPYYPSYPSAPSIPSVPSYLPSPEKRKKPSKLTGMQAGYHALVKKDATKKHKKRWVRVTKKPVTERQAKGIGAKAVDETVSRTFKVVPSKKQAQSNLKYDMTWGIKQHKFRKPVRKGKQIQSDKWIEKSKYNIDTPGEFRGITVQGWKAKHRIALEGHKHPSKAKTMQSQAYTLATTKNSKKALKKGVFKI